MKSNSFIFSIIMPIYNVEQWLDEAIHSILEQKNINFEKDIQLILVNDSSPDNCEEICIKYQNIYPNNILYVKNSKNLGLSATRNHGLQYATGKYVNFFDPDDKLSENVLYEVKKFFDNHDKEIAHVSIPLIFFEAATGIHPKYSILGQKNRIINLNDEGYNFILSSASSFYKLDNIKGMKFDTTLFGEEDTLFNFRIYQTNKNIGYVCENNVCYHYRKRESGGSQVDLSRIKPQAFHTPIQLLEKIQIDRNSILFYELCIYELRSRLKTIRPEIFENVEEYNLIINKYREFISLIPKSFIFRGTKFLDDYDEKIAFITEIYKKQLSINSEAFIVIDGDSLFKINDIPIDIKKFELKNNILSIEILFNNYGLHDLNLVIMDDNKKIILPCLHYKTDSIYIKQSAGIKSSRTLDYAKFEIPMFKEGIYRFYFKRRSNDYLHIVNRIKTYSESPFLPSSVFNSAAFKLYSDVKTSVSFFHKKFIIQRYSKLEKLSNRIKCFLIIKKMHNEFKWLRLFKMRKNKFWLFNDRPINANDNAEYLFEYINNNKEHSNIAKYCYFVLAKNSPDLDRIKKIGKVVIQNSIKHKLLYLNAKYIFTSHLATPFFKPISFKFLKYYNDLIESEIVWLQHGVTMNNIESAANKFNKQVSKVVTSASFEPEIFEKSNFFYDKKDIIKSGFPRYDKLKKSNGKTILIMPTWRSYLSGKILPNGLHAEKDNFIDSTYFQNFFQLLSNNFLLEKLKDSSYKIKFVLHPGFKQYAKYFSVLNNKYIEIIDKKSFSYNQLFNESCLMITDYSSVFFDFSYKKKPCLFFQFDQEQFYGEHYKKGLFDFETMAPGKVVTSLDDLINEITYLINNNMKMDKLYLNRVKQINKYDDGNNCERILMELIKNG